MSSDCKELSEPLCDLLGDRSIASHAKARFFGSSGFSADQWDVLAKAFRDQAQRVDVSMITTPWSVKHVATGEVDAPAGRRCEIVTVWISEGALTRLVTAYPAKEAMR
jgi:hypothetical protein